MVEPILQGIFLVCVMVLFLLFLVAVLWVLGQMIRLIWAFIYILTHPTTDGYKFHRIVFIGIGIAVLCVLVLCVIVYLLYVV